MMRLRHMVMNTDSSADELVGLWQRDQGSLRFWRASSNFVYWFTQSGAKRYLRFSNADDNTPPDILAELAFMQYLRSNRYSCVQPVPSLRGNLVETLETQTGTHHAVVFSEAPGTNRLEIGDLAPAQFLLWGRAMGEMHRLSQSYKPARFIRDSWKEQLGFVESMLAQAPDEDDARDELERIAAWQGSLPVTGDVVGLIHYDMELDNLFWSGDADQEQITVIDFDDAMYHWFAMDIACALRDLDELGPSEAQTGLGWFLKGYRSLMTLDDDQLELVPRFKRWQRLVEFARLMRSMRGSEPGQADWVDPEWLARLRPRLLNRLEEHRQAFREPW